MSSSVQSKAITALVLGGGYYYFVHHKPGPGEWDEAQVTEWLEESFETTEFEYYAASPRDVDILDTQFQAFFGSVVKDGRSCEFVLQQHENARLVFAEMDCSTATNGNVQLRKEFRSASHYNFAGFSPEGCANEILENLVITFFDTPYGSDGNQAYWNGVQTALDAARSEDFKDECLNIFNYIDSQHAAEG